MGFLDRLIGPPHSGSATSTRSDNPSRSPRREKYTSARLAAMGEVKTRGNRAVVTSRSAHRTTHTGYDRNPGGTWSPASR